MGAEQGMFYPDGHFESDNDIRRRLALENEITPIMETPLPIERDFFYWSNRFIRRAGEFNETQQRRDHVTIQFDAEPTIINFIGDLHIGSPDTDYHRIQQEAEAIVNTPNSYVLAIGDWVDGFFFNPAQFEQIEQSPEQFNYMRQLLKYYADHRRLLVAWGGDHDLWANKCGADPYAAFSEATGAYYMQGVGYLTARVGNIEYKISAAHRHNGFSIYNKAHAAIRLYRDGAEGADICVTAHSHQKAHHIQAVHEFGGNARNVEFISVGPYKATDEYSRKKGHPRQAPAEMYGQAIVLDPTIKKVTYYHDIIAANASV
jgi:hypothetical protein